MNTHPNLQLLLALLVLLLSLIVLLIGIWHLSFVPLALGAIGLYAALALGIHTESPNTTSHATFQ